MHLQKAWLRLRYLDLLQQQAPGTLPGCAQLYGVLQETLQAVWGGACLLLAICLLRLEIEPGGGVACL